MMWGFGKKLTGQSVDTFSHQNGIYSKFQPELDSHSHGTQD
jgi:hypothetical protein